MTRSISYLHSWRETAPAGGTRRIIARPISRISTPLDPGQHVTRYLVIVAWGDEAPERGATIYRQF